MPLPFDPLTGNIVYRPEDLGLAPDPLGLVHSPETGMWAAPMLAAAPSAPMGQQEAPADQQQAPVDPMVSAQPNPAADIEGILTAYRRPSLSSVLAAAGEGALNADPFADTLGTLASAAVAAGKAASAGRGSAPSLPGATGSTATGDANIKTEYMFQRRDAEGNAVGDPTRVPKDRANQSRQYLFDPKSKAWVQYGEPTPLTPRELLDDGDKDRLNKEMEEKRAQLDTLGDVTTAFNQAKIEDMNFRGRGFVSTLYDEWVSPVMATVGLPGASEHLQALELVDKATINGILDAAEKLTGPKSDKDIELLRNSVGQRYGDGEAPEVRPQVGQ